MKRANAGGRGWPNTWAGRTFAGIAVIMAVGWMPGSPDAAARGQVHRVTIEPPPAGSVFLATDRFNLADGRVGEVERGLIFLPATRTSDTDDVVAVEFHRFPATGANRGDSDPIVELRGGPGFGGLSANLANEGFYERWVAPFRQYADYIVVGQRGFGPSRPSLRCGEYEQPVFDETAPEELRMERAAAAAGACRDFWLERDVAFEGFNVREAAADVAAVVRALGYDRVSLFANSFGSHWALAVMRYHPELVARAVLGGLEGPDHTYDMPGHVLEALRRVASDAEQSPRLRDRIPEGGLVAALETVVERLRDAPVTLEVQDEDTGEMRSVTVNHLIAQSVAEDGYSDAGDDRHSMAAWPADILDMYHGRYEGLAREALDEPTEGYGYIPSAGYFLYDCASGISAARKRQLLSDPAAAVLGRENWLYEGVCPVFGVDLEEDFRTAFRTDIPTVIVQGTWDTSTPIENVYELLPRFTDVKFIPIERGTHSALWLSFLDEPIPEVRRLGEALFRFAATGDKSLLPESVTLPPVEWKIPESVGGRSGTQDRGWQPLVSEGQRRAYEGNRYAPVVRIGDMLIASGVVGVSRDGDNSPRGQFRKALVRVGEILEEHGLSFADVAEITTYHVNLGELGYEFVEVKDEFWPEPPYPAWTAIGVDRLFGANALIEIRFTAALPSGRS